MTNKKGKIDYLLIVITLLLVGIGILEVFSSSYYLELGNEASRYRFVYKHAMMASIGLFLMVITSFINYNLYKKIGYLFLIPLFTILILVFTPLGETINGARRWIDLFGFSFMPSEWTKLLVILVMAKALTAREQFTKKFLLGVIPYIVFAGFVAGLILLQPNLSAAVINVALIGVLIFLSGVKWSHIMLILSSGVGAIYYFATSSDYRAARILSFKDPFADPLGHGWQIINSLYALGLGGLFGRGIGRGTQNKLYLPEPQNDFILATIGEELGFMGISLVLFLYLILIYRGFKIAMKTKDRFAFYTAAGITSLITIQVTINFMVVGSLMPVTGVTLPFISYGGNAIVMNLIAIGILLNISKNTERIRS